MLPICPADRHVGARPRRVAPGHLHRPRRSHRLEHPRRPAPGTKLVDITYDLADPGVASVSIWILVSQDAGTNWNVPAYTFTGAYGVSPGLNKAVVWNAGADWNGQYTANCRVRVLANDADPAGLALIPAGPFQMGDPLDGDIADARPVHSVNVSAFYMDKSLITGARWIGVYQWGTLHGYTFDNAGAAKANDHPVQSISWFDAVKWCNARSEQEGRTPAYYTDAALTVIYKTGQAAPFVNWSANGYRLPTEAEWEKAARGGLSGQRFPWGLTITHSQANYNSSSSYSYDTSPTRGYNPAYAVGSQPYTSPVAVFQPNGYGLFDMAGNVWEWCWDWLDGYYYSSSPGTDPHGPASGNQRVLRGGSWYFSADLARCANRNVVAPTNAGSDIGFRCVRGF